ncbi:MAG: 50S ribosomal protein L9 [Alphaproteobacteria bacterium]|nr:50S ribosomal protein L9 [Alphaproteobacteria bacterium]
MRVVLLTDIKGMGGKGSVVEVSSGYAYSYLIPNKKAVEAISGIATQTLEEKKHSTENKKKSIIEKELVTGHIPRSIIFEEQIKENGELYRTINQGVLVQKLKKVLTFITAEDVTAPQIKKVGEYEIMLTYGGKKIPIVVVVSTLQEKKHTKSKLL